jgi:hypothetical protein
MSKKLTTILLLRWMSCHCVRTSTFFYLDCYRTSTFSLKLNVDVLSHVIRGTWKCFGLFGGCGRNVIMLKSRPDDGTHWPKTMTEPRMTEPRKTEPRKTERRKTEPRMTDPRMTEPRIGPNLEWPKLESDQTSNDHTSKRTEPRIGPNLEWSNLKWDWTSKDQTSNEIEPRKWSSKFNIINLMSVGEFIIKKIKNPPEISLNQPTIWIFTGHLLWLQMVVYQWWAKLQL